MLRFVTLLNNAVRRGGFVFLGTLIERLTFFLVFAFLARTSEPSSYGIIVSAFAFCNLLQSLFDLGLSVYFQRESSASSQSLFAELSSALWLKAFLVLPYLALTGLYFLSNKSGGIYLIVIVSCVVIGYSIVSLLNGVLYGRSLFRESLRIQVFGRSILFVLVPLLTFLGNPPAVILSVMLLSLGLQIFSLGRYIVHKFQWRDRTFRMNLLSTVLRSSAPIGLGLFMVALYDRIDVLIIQRMMGLEAVAFYAVAYSVYKLPLIASGIVLVPAFTTLSKEFSEHGRIRVSTLLQSTILQVIFAIVATAALLLAPATWLAFFYGTRYAVSGYILSTLAIALPAIFLNNMAGVALNAVHKERLPFLCTVLGAAVNIGANITLIPHYGILGAALATVAAEYAVFLSELAFLWLNKSMIGQIPPLTSRGTPIIEV